MAREPFLFIINKHHFSYIFKTHYVSDSLPGSKEIMFPATLKAKNLKAAMEEAKVERRARGRDRTWLNAKMALRGGPVAAPGDPLQRTLRLEFKNVRLLESGRKSCDYDSLPNGRVWGYARPLRKWLVLI